jgi:hypothetical protein
MISVSALNLALATVSLSRSLYDKMSYEELQKYLQDYNYKYNNNNNNFEDAKNILLEAKYYNPLTYMNNFINHNFINNNLMFANMRNVGSMVPTNTGSIVPTNNYKSYSYTKEIRSSNGNGYIKEENYSYNGKDKPTITSTYSTITNGKVDGNKSIRN